MLLERKYEKSTEIEIPVSCDKESYGYVVLAYSDSNNKWKEVSQYVTSEEEIENIVKEFTSRFIVLNREDIISSYCQNKQQSMWAWTDKDVAIGVYREYHRFS
jgi:hypothetical protein